MTNSEAAEITATQISYYTQYRKRPKALGEINDPKKRKVVTTGYISADQRLKNYIESGQRLAEARNEQYDADFKTDPKTIKRNPMRDRGTDFADADKFYKGIRERSETAQKKQHEAYQEYIAGLKEKAKENEAKKDTTETPPAAQSGVT